ncbi:hypothetical protein GF318_01150 [Candidatus Micrarchaeota archaeon]|nr:hypothetical protein [Candidatus Micrarchaeota archaeon]
MKPGLLFLLLVSFSFAVAPSIHEQKNLGFYRHPEFTYSLSVNCEKGTVRVIVMDANLTKVGNASTFLKYVDYDTPLISSRKSDQNGYAIHELPGNTSLMRGLFILVLEKKGYRSKEIHFDISGCYANQTYPSPPEEEEEPMAANETAGANKTRPPVEQNTTNVSMESNQTNETVNMTAEAEEPEAPGLCAGAGLALLLFFNVLRRY